MSPAFDIFMEAADAVMQIDSFESAAVISGRGTGHMVIDGNAEVHTEASGIRTVRAKSMEEVKDPRNHAFSQRELLQHDSNMIQNAVSNSVQHTAEAPGPRSSKRDKTVELWLLWGMAAFGLVFSGLLGAVALLDDCSCTCSS
jgi:hypothetical protein